MKQGEGKTTSALQSAGIHPPGAAAMHLPPQVPDHELLRPIGRGACGEVWLARSTLGTLRAVKVVYRSSFDSEKPFEREFNGIQRFEPISRAHEGFVDVLQAGRNEAGGYFYYVMELADDASVGQASSLTVEGASLPRAPETGGKMPPELAGRMPAPHSYIPRTLRSLLRPSALPSTPNFPATPTRLPIAQCVEIALSLTTALGRLHKEGLVHRDIKPSNIIFVGGLPKLADIGLVASVTEARSFVGTEGFIPPEGPGAAQADLYSLGKVLYEMSTGKDRHDFPELPTDVRELPNRAQLIEFNEVVLKACQNDLNKRYQSAEEMHADLALLQSGKSVRHVHQLERRLERMKKYGLIAAALMLLAGGITLFQKRETWKAQRHAQETERLLNRAVQAEQEGEQKLWQAYLAQARANRWSGKAGRRFDSLAAISNAALLPPTTIASNKLALRNEASAAMALTDLRIAKEWNNSHSWYSYVTFDSNLERYARGQGNGEISLRRVADDAELFLLPGLEHWGHTFLRFSVDDRLLGALYAAGTGSTPARFRLWDLDRQAPVLDLDSGTLGSIDFSANGKWVALGQRKREVRFYSLETLAEHRRFSTASTPRQLSFSPDSHLLAVWVRRGVDIHSVDTGELVLSLPHNSSIHHFTWSSDGKLLAAGCTDSRIYLWDVTVTNRPPVPRSILEGHTAQVVGLAFSPKGQLLASSSWDGTTRLWDVNTGKFLVSTPGLIRRFSADGKGLAFDLQPNLGIWEVAYGDECRTLPGHLGEFTSISFGADGRLMASSGKDGLRLHDMAADKELILLPLSTTHNAILHPDGETLLTSESSGVRLWPMRHNLTDSEAHWQIGPPRKLPFPVEPYRSDLSAEGRFLAVISGPGAILLDLKTPDRPLREFKHRNASNVTINHNGRFIAIGNWKGQDVKVFDAQSDQELAILPVPGDSATAKFSPEGKWLLTGSPFEYVFWETGSWQRHHAVARADAGDVGGQMCFSPDGKSVAVAHTRRLVKLLETDTGRELATLEAGPQVPCAFSPDGSQLVVSTEAGTLQIWDLRSVRQQLAAIKLDWETTPHHDPHGVPASAGGTQNLSRSLTSSNVQLADAGTPYPPLTITVITSTVPASVAVEKPRMVSQDLSEHERLLLIPSRDPLVNPDLIDLSAHYNLSLVTSGDIRGNNLARMPRGIQTFGGVEFDVRGAIQLGGRGIQKHFGINYPKEVRGIPVGRKFRRLHLLHTTGWFVEDGAVIGSYVIHYADGQQREAPTIYGQDVRGADARHGVDEITRGTLAWKGTNDADIVHRVWKSFWENPRPEFEVASIDYVSKMTACNPYLIAMTVEGDTPPQAFRPHIRKKRPVPIDLSSHYNAPLDEGWHGPSHPAKHLGDLPHGRQTLAGIEFDLRGIVQLSGLKIKERGAQYPKEVTGIRIAQKCGRLHFLHATADKADDGTYIGLYVVHYADSWRHYIFIHYGQHLRDWNLSFDTVRDLQQSSLAWQGTNVPNYPIGLFKFSWSNPRPGVEIESLDFVSTMTDAAPFLVALTAEPGGDVPKLVFPPRDAKAEPKLIDLTSYYNARLDEDWHHKQIVEDSFQNFPAGIVVCTGTEFDARGLIQLKNGPPAMMVREYPQRVDGIQIGQRCQRLHFLHGTGGIEFPSGNNSRFASYIVHYVDGQETEVPILYGKGVRHWQTYKGKPAEPDTPLPAWQGTQSRLHLGEPVGIRLYKTTWNNPRAGVPVERIDFISVGTNATPFLVAVTAE